MTTYNRNPHLIDFRLAAAINYSFMATFKLQRIDPSKWLEDVLHRGNVGRTVHVFCGGSIPMMPRGFGCSRARFVYVSSHSGECRSTARMD